MDIIWTNPAKKDLKQIFNYYKNKVSKTLADKIINSIFEKITILKTQNIGTKEELLEQLDQNHRYIIDGNYKIIYIILDNSIYITHVFDTRQNPTKIITSS